MVRVCVVGGGTAGVSAGAEAARQGAEVTILESEDGPTLSRRKWPDLLTDPRASREASAAARCPSGVEIEYGTAVHSLAQGHRLQTSRGQVVCDSVVVATGSKSLSGAFQGTGKSGVHILSSVSCYLDLGCVAPSVEKPVVYGRGLTSLRVASALSGGRRKVVVLSPGGVTDPKLNPAIVGAVRREAESKGVSLRRADHIRALGQDRVEALVADGWTFECDEVAVVPTLAPNRPSSDLPEGPHGCILTNFGLEASWPGYYAAGGCSETPFPGGHTVSLEDSAVSSGRVAGANAAGGSVRFTGTCLFETTLFGLAFASAGLSLWDARAAGFDATESGFSDRTLVCSVVSDRESGRVLGGQALGKEVRGVAPSMLLFASRSVSIRSLVCGELDCSTDISPLVQAVTQGLNWRRGRDGNGPGVRPGRD